MPRKKKNIKLEDSFHRLDEIINQLEDETLSLDDSLKLFEEGVHLSRQLEEILQNAELKVKTLLGEDEI